jgi:ABC-type glutathione transport system ATPase component
MYLGQDRRDRPRDDIYRAPMHPYTQALLSAVPIESPNQRGKRAGSCSRATCRARRTRPRAAASGRAAGRRRRSAPSRSRRSSRTIPAGPSCSRPATSPRCCAARAVGGRGARRRADDDDLAPATAAAARACAARARGP